MDLPEEHQRDGMEEVLSVYADEGGNNTIVMVKPAYVEVMSDDGIAAAEADGQPVVPLPNGAAYVDPGQWGIVLADTVNHVTMAFGEQVGATSPEQFHEIRNRVLHIMGLEIMNPGAPLPWERS